MLSSGSLPPYQLLLTVCRLELTESLLDSLPTSAIVQIIQKLNPRLYIDFIRYLPAEICLNILGYLDPVSLISVARSCRAWYGLTLDRKLWERLYYLEGWKADNSELQIWEEKINRDRPIPSEGRHASKRRAISSSRHAATDRDHEMQDINTSWPSAEPGPGPAPASSAVTSSLFGNNSSADTSLLSPRLLSAEDLTAEGTRSKGKQRMVSSPLSSPVGNAASPLAAAASARSPTATLSKPTLWTWDASSDKLRMNWKHLYTLRRRLEANWEMGRFTNFQLPRPDHPEEAHGECIYTIQFNSNYLVSGSRDRTIRIWNMKTRRLVRAPLAGHRGSVLCLQFDSDPDEDLIVSGSSDSDVILWRFSTGEAIQRLHRAHREPVLNVKFDKNILVTCSKDKTIKIFNRRELKAGDLGYGELPVQPVPIHLKNYGYDSLDHLPIKPPYTIIGSLEGHSAAVNAVQIHGREIVSASGDRNVKIWDWPSQNCIRTLIGHHKGIACVQYDGRRIVSGSSDNEVKVFDRLTGLEVASLRSHANLVRTVQAGFGDLPYSAEEDEKEAANVDQRYMDAVESGDMPSTPPHQRRNGGSRRRETSSNNKADSDGEDDVLRPENIRYTGAKLPPGGGGGQYGRIVSGSYDTTIIIWRRDKRGVWKVQHQLKQEDAAAAAGAVARNLSGSSIRRRVHPLGANTLEALDRRRLNRRQQPVGPNEATAAGAAQPGGPIAGEGTSAAGPAAGTAFGALPATSIYTELLQQNQRQQQQMGASAAAFDPQRVAQLTALIDDLIAQGVHALQQALTTFPALLSMQGTLQAAIDRHPSPFVRSQLRQTVSIALVRANAGNARPGATHGAALPLSVSTAAAAATAAAATMAGMPIPAGAPGPSTATTAGPSVAPIDLQLPHPFGTAGAQPATAPGGGAQHATVSLHPVPPAAEHQPGQQAPHPATLVAGAPPPAAPTAAAAGAAGAAGEAVAHAGHHPHMHGGDGSNPARVFKLQFDARQIICCSQTPVIVGWDFCNEDAELEEAVRFFKTVE